MPQNAIEETFEEITVLNKPALFTCNRLDRGTVPKGLYAYDVRHDDDCQGIPCEISKYIIVNHWGTILLAEPLDLRDKGFLLIDEDNDWNYAPVDEKPRTLAAIEYLGTNGTVCETQEFCDASQFKKTVKEELYYGVPLNMVIYEFSAEKHHISMDWVSELDTLPCGMRYEAHADERRVPCRTVQEFLQTYGQNKDTYEIWQIRDVGACSYAFLFFDAAQKQLDVKDYRKAYSAKLPPKTNLESLFVLHNEDDRPAAQTMRSMSVSDIVVLHQNGQTTAHYVDSFGFCEIPDFADKLKKEMEMAAKKQNRVHGER